MKPMSEPRHTLYPEQVDDRVHLLLERFRDNGYEGYVAGGAVRDLIQDLEPKDWDVATRASVEEVQRIAAQALPWDVVATGAKHGTVTVYVGDLAIEVTTYRGDGTYSDGRRPDNVIFVKTIEEDLARRDFTMNAMAYDPLRNVLIDPFKGQDDMRTRTLRAVGDPNKRFAEDGLRIMRGIRFAARNDYTIEPATLAAMKTSRDMIKKVSVERIRDELMKILAAMNPSYGFELMSHVDIRDHVLPEFAGLDMVHLLRTFEILRNQLRRSGKLRDTALLAALLHANGNFMPQPEYILKRLRFSNQIINEVLEITDNIVDYGAAETDTDLRKVLGRISREGADLIHEIYKARLHAKHQRESDAVASQAARVAAIYAAKDPLRLHDLAINGSDIVNECGVPPSARVGELLEELLQHVLANPAANTRDNLLKIVRHSLAR